MYQPETSPLAKTAAAGATRGSDSCSQVRRIVEFMTSASAGDQASRVRRAARPGIILLARSKAGSAWRLMPGSAWRLTLAASGSGYRQVMAIQYTSAPPAEPARSSWPARHSGRLRARPVPDAIDVAIAVACFAVFTLPALTGLGSRIGSPAAVAGFGLAAAAPLILRRKWPVAVVAACYLAATIAGVRFTPFVSNAGPNLAIAVFTAADRCRRRTSLAAAAAASFATWAILALGVQLYPGQGQDAVTALAVIPAWLAGDVVRVRRSYRHRLEAQSRREAAEHDLRVRAEERLRLSREVHDVLSHSLSMIAVRSGVARLVLDEQPEEARVALSAIETASRSALDDLRQLLRQIREPAAEREPATPTLGDLPGLVERVRNSGLDVSYLCAGEPAGYGTALELSAYRVVQEALTNVVRHARATSAAVQVAHGETGLTISVTDDGTGQPRSAGPPGHGIAGMRERAAMLGGELSAGARPEGGFAVVARLPAKDTAR